MSKPSGTSPASQIRRAALNLLARRDHSHQELKRKLQIRGYGDNDIRPLMDELTQSGLINEYRFTENYIHWRRNKGMGPQRIALELRHHGVTEEMIAELLNIADNAWFTAIRTVWKKQFKGRFPANFKDRAKQLRFLQYRGFTQEQIKSVFEVGEEID